MYPLTTFSGRQTNLAEQFFHMQTLRPFPQRNKNY